MINESIGCKVTACKFHDESKNYCTLDVIKVTHNTVSDATCVCDTDCGSFEPGK
ncbi:DUF1540 domain-containing protein [Clostridium cylindrosporum]|uniref:DUF1540 domain-containing protein n=1 Tax=Clostridium cylindrosporum DSM 605 TaxID=1121307 RepID=A0A0J8G065_CLOCY|nr:hypothetical protein CLCY_1c04250 [Clostridium cylindrosporum DSM 605]